MAQFGRYQVMGWCLGISSYGRPCFGLIACALPRGCQVALTLLINADKYGSGIDQGEELVAKVNVVHSHATLR